MREWLRADRLIQQVAHHHNPAHTDDGAESEGEELTRADRSYQLSAPVIGHIDTSTIRRESYTSLEVELDCQLDFWFGRLRRADLTERRASQRAARISKTGSVCGVEDLQAQLETTGGSERHILTRDMSAWPLPDRPKSPPPNLHK